MFLKLYTKERPMCSLAGGVDKDTFRKWTWLFIEAIADLESCLVSSHWYFNDAICILHTPLQQIICENRLKKDTGNDCLISVDGTDFRIPERGRAYYSHKYKKLAFRYEVALCILTGDIVWINGPYEAGRWPDISIFRNSLWSFLEPGERVGADDGYVGDHPTYVKCPAGFANSKEAEYMQRRVLNRQETVNKRFKQWGCLKQVWRARLPKHADAFRAVVVVTQMSINHGEPLFQCGYRDPPYWLPKWTICPPVSFGGG